MRFGPIATLLAATLLAAAGASAKDSTADKREKTRKMASQTLADLYKLHPAAQGLSRSRPDTRFSAIWA